MSEPTAGFIPEQIELCMPRRRCNRWRTCEPCARLRQAKIAQITETGVQKCGDVCWTIISKIAPDEVKKVKQSVMRTMSKKSQGGIWTLENHQQSNLLHLNMIWGTPDYITAQRLEKALKRHGEVWTQAIDKKDAAHVGAYICKQRSLPAGTDWEGNLYGRWGCFRKPMEILAEEGRGAAMPIATEALLAVEEIGGADATMKPSTAQPWPRLTAIEQGELELNGYTCVGGSGISSIEQAQKMGMLRDEK